MTAYPIPVYQSEPSGNKRRFVLECLGSTWIWSKSRFIAEFETECANLVGAKLAVGVCKVTMALHLALLTPALEPGDEVIVPTLTSAAGLACMSLN